MIPINIQNIPVKHNLALVRNDVTTKTFSFKRDNVDYDFTGSDVVMKIAVNFDMPASYTITGSITDNEVAFDFTGTETAIAGEFVYDIQETLASLNIDTLVKGILTIEKDVTP